VSDALNTAIIIRVPLKADKLLNNENDDSFSGRALFHTALMKIIWHGR
jgi:hypothetical protein